MNEQGGDDATRATAQAVARKSYGKLVALISARTRDVVVAEEALSEAFLAALKDWPRNGCPANPEAWLLTTARRKAIDLARRQQRTELVPASSPSFVDCIAAFDEDEGIPDHRLALMFACAHPAIETGIRAPLMLQVVLGLDAKTIASAFLVSPAAMGQRLSRAKNKIRAAGIPLRVPEREELKERTSAVLDAVYAAFTEGWSDPGGLDVSRHDLVEEAIFLARVVVELMPEEPEALGLLALMLHAEARRPARRSASGDFVPLAEQDPNAWNVEMIEEAEAFLRRAGAFGKVGRYQLEAALQSAHVSGRRTGRPDFSSLVVLYDALLVLTESPVVAVNRALAIAELRGTDEALSLLEALSSDERLAQYQPYWVARAELFARAGDAREAQRAYDLAIGLERDPAVRRFLQGRKATLQVPLLRPKG